MRSGAAYLFAIIFFVIALNFYFLVFRTRKGNRRKRMNRVAVDEAKQALWREKEVARRIEREQDDALERVKLRNETLALYEEVRRRHAHEDELERLSLDQIASQNELERLGLGTYYPEGDQKNDDPDPY